MKNTAQYRFTAKKIIAKLEARLEKETAPLYADWIISLMREGFKKQDAVDAFRKSKFILLADGSITTKDRQKDLKKRKRLILQELQESLPESSYSLSGPAAAVENFRSLAEAQRKQIDHMQWELMRVQEAAHRFAYENKRDSA